jgi:hypothetical protein
MARLFAEQRAEDAAKARIRERALRASATTDATLAGIVLDLAERAETVSVRTTAGRSLTGRVLAVARDAIALEAGDTTTYVPLAAIAALRTPAGRVDEPSGSRPLPAVSLAALLADLAPERPTVRVMIVGDPALWRGELRAVGADVLTLRIAGDPPTTAYIPLDQLSELTVLASG